jgi:hypothetical protein
VTARHHPDESLAQTSPALGGTLAGGVAVARGGPGQVPTGAGPSADAPEVEVAGGVAGQWRDMASGLRQVLLLGSALALCPIGALLIGDEPAAPVRRGTMLAELERAAGLHFEPAVHGWVLDHGALMDVASLLYVFAHIAVAAWALVWTWWLRRDRFALVRDIFLVTQLLTVVAYVAVPTAPPRLLPRAGFEDTLTGLWGRAVADCAHLLQSPFAAMPSGHVAFALIAGGTFTVLGDRRWLRGFGRAYPPLVVTVTIVTGHHLWLDAVGAVLVVATASAVVVSLRRAATCAPPERSPSSAAVRRSGPWTEHPEGKSCAAVSRS